MTDPRRKKPVKPRATFPLSAHLNGQWCKKIRGTVLFFGVWSNPDAARANDLPKLACAGVGDLDVIQNHGGREFGHTVIQRSPLDKDPFR